MCVRNINEHPNAGLIDKTEPVTFKMNEIIGGMGDQEGTLDSIKIDTNNLEHVVK